MSTLTPTTPTTAIARATVSAATDLIESQDWVTGYGDHDPREIDRLIAQADEIAETVREHATELADRRVTYTDAAIPMEMHDAVFGCDDLAVSGQTDTGTVFVSKTGVIAKVTETGEGTWKVRVADANRAHVVPDPVVFHSVGDVCHEVIGHLG